ncbi:MAG: glycosyltransferase family 2 protein [Bacteroidia bacterium]
MYSSEYPKISVVLPCYNMELYIEETLKSIVKQDYPNLELIIVDGGSVDGTLQIIDKYKAHIFKLISEPDDGQYEAVVKGFSYATGEIFCWLNADDVFFSWTLSVVSTVFKQKQDLKWLIGIPTYLNEDGSLKKMYNNPSAKPIKALRNGWFRKGGYGHLQQESMFWKRELWEQSNGLNLKYKMAADFELWINFAKYSELWTLNLSLSAFRIRSNGRSNLYKDLYDSEVKEISRSLRGLPLLFRIFGRNQMCNFLLRSCTWKKTKLIYQPFNLNKWVYKDKYRSVSSLTLSALLLENDNRE